MLYIIIIYYISDIIIIIISYFISNSYFIFILISMNCTPNPNHFISFSYRIIFLIVLLDVSGKRKDRKGVG